MTTGVWTALIAIIGGFAPSEIYVQQTPLPPLTLIHEKNLPENIFYKWLFKHLVFFLKKS